MRLLFQMQMRGTACYSTKLLTSETPRQACGSTEALHSTQHVPTRRASLSLHIVPFSTLSVLQIASWEAYFCSPCSLILSSNWYYRKQSRKNLPLRRAPEYYYCIKKINFKFLGNRQEHGKHSILLGLNIQVPRNTHPSFQVQRNVYDNKCRARHGSTCL